MLVLDDMDCKAEIYTNTSQMEASQQSKQIKLKSNRLHTTLMSYLRAHLMLTYPKTIKSGDVQTPSDLAFELYVIDAYSKFLYRV
jgi:hypothetical protein